MDCGDDIDACSELAVGMPQPLSVEGALQYLGTSFRADYISSGLLRIGGSIASGGQAGVCCIAR